MGPSISTVLTCLAMGLSLLTPSLSSANIAPPPELHPPKEVFHTQQFGFAFEIPPRWHRISAPQAPNVFVFRPNHKPLDVALSIVCFPVPKEATSPHLAARSLDKLRKKHLKFEVLRKTTVNIASQKAFSFTARYLDRGNIQRARILEQTQLIATRPEAQEAKTQACVLTFDGSEPHVQHVARDVAAIYQSFSVGVFTKPVPIPR